MNHECPLFTRLSFQRKRCSGSAVADLGSRTDTCISPPPFPIAPSSPQDTVYRSSYTQWMGMSVRQPSPRNANIPFSLADGIRRSAFEKLAALAVKSPARDDGSELARLAQQSRTRKPDGALNGVFKCQTPTSRIPMVSCDCAWPV